MLLPHGATVAVADGETLKLFRNIGDETHPKLSLLPTPSIDDEARGTAAGHRSSSANPDNSQQEEDGFTVGVAAMLNKAVLTGKIESLLIIAAPRTLGELRKHYHQKLSAVLFGELSKDLTGHSTAEVEKAIAAA